MIVKLKVRWTGGHMETKVFVGEAADRLALTGTLMLDVGQWQLIGAALGLGAAHTLGRLRVETEGEAEALAAVAEAERRAEVRGPMT